MNKNHIKTGHIYYVDYDPVRNGEFGGGRHLAVIWKENDNGRSYISIPMTSHCTGNKDDQVSLGYLKCLPKRLRKSKTYAVPYQTRTVSPERIYAVYEHGKPMNVELPNGRMKKLRDGMHKTFVAK